MAIADADTDIETIVLYHLEDDPHWVNIVREKTSKINGLRYVSINGTVKGFFSMLPNLHPPAILVFDLRIEGDENEIYTVTMLMQKATELVDRGLTVIVLSGFLDPAWIQKLVALGIDSQNIIEKDEFDDKQFLHQIRHPRESRIVPRIDNPDDPTICEISASLNGIHEPSLATFFADRANTVDVYVRTHPALTDKDSITIYPLCEAADIVPPISEIELPVPPETSSVRFFMNFVTNSREARSLRLLFFRGNHLIGISEYPIKVI